MRYKDVIELVSAVGGTDADGYPDIEEVSHEVFADVQSVRRTEFYSAAQTGLNLSMTYVIRCCDYTGEKLINHDGKRYKVERTHTKDGEFMELNCSDEKGKKV